MHYFLPISPCRLSLVEKRVGTPMPERKEGQGLPHTYIREELERQQNSLPPPAQSGSFLVVCQSGLNNCSGNCWEIKANNTFKCTFIVRGLPAERKWLVIKKEKVGELEKESLHYQFKILTELEQRASEL